MSSKTIAKNTLFLYIRMFLVMGVTLYTSRIVLRELGVSDYGLYSLIGGIVTMFAFLNSAMSTATQRYLSYDLGKKNEKKLQKTFSATLTIHFGIALLLLILAETIGLWYINNKVVLPSDRLFAANVIYQFSVATALIGVIQVPYDSLIIAYERMNVYAYVSIVEVILKLGIVFLLVFFGTDKLITYAILVFIVSVIIRLIYQIYCRKNFKASKFEFSYDRFYYKELISYSGWNLFGNIANVAKGQGINIIINLFFGTVVNAAYGLSLQVQTAVKLFVNNFQKALNPQIIKTYSEGSSKRNHILIFKSSKFSFFLMLLIIMPIVFNIEFVLKLWLKNPPEYTAPFVQLSLLSVLIDSLSGPIMTGVQATGKIKWYQIIVGGLLFLNLPISYALLYMGLDVVYIFVVNLVISIISYNFRIVFLKNLIGFNLKKYYTNVVCRILLISVICTIVYLYKIKLFVVTDFIDFTIASILLVIFLLFLIYMIGVDRQEKILIKNYLKKINQKKFQNY